MSYSVHIEKFDGPLDLLLQLVESQELVITSISLMEVTEPFLKHLEEQRGNIPPEELADFLIVASKLVYLKSKALLPSLYDPSLEEGPDLETQLRMYKAFVEAAKRLGEMANLNRSSYNRTPRAIHSDTVTFAPPKDVTALTLQQSFKNVLKRLEPIVFLPKAAIERVVTIEEKIHELGQRVKSAMRISFKRFLSESKDRTEMIVGFLALLELIKQRSVHVEQADLFEDIHLQSAT